jgi:hypothetical protein
MTRYKFVTHNPGDLDLTRGRGMVVDYLKQVEPDGIVMPEGEGYREVLQRRGYRVRVSNPGLGTYILVGVRDDHKIVAANKIDTHETWRGPKVATRRVPRVHQLVTFETDKDVLFDLTGVHFAFGGPDGVNSASWQESARILSARWNKRQALPKERHQVNLGDWNGSKADLRADLHMLNSRVLNDDLTVDHIVVSESLEMVSGRRLATVPAHPPYMWTVEG